MTDAEILQLLDDTNAKLVEHFDAVQIMVTWNENGNTRDCLRGAGNWHARQGMAHMFIERDVAQEHADCLGKQLNPPSE